MFGLSPTFLWIASFAIAAAVVNSLGIYAIFRHREWADKNKTYFMCFAAGVLVATPLILALPNALSNHPDAGFWALFGFLFMYFSNQIVKKYSKQETTAFGITAAEGIGIHSLIDGVVYTATFSASVLVGVMAGIGLVVHEFAEGIIVYLVLLKGGTDEVKAAWYAFITAALTTPLGAFVAYPFIHQLDKPHLGLMMGFVAGVLLYVSASHLLPEAREYEKIHSVWAFLSGVALALFIVFTKTAA